MNRRTALATAAGAVFASGAVAGMPRRATGEALVPIRVATLAIDPSAQALYAADLGFFKEHGLDAQLTILNNATAIVTAVASGAVDVGFGTTPGVALAYQHGIPVRFLVASGIYTGPVGNTILMIPVGSTVTSGADLTGKVVAVSGLKDMTQFETAAWIDKTGGDAKAVHFIEMPYSEMTAAMDQGRASAACLVEPYVTIAKSSCKILANLSDTLGGPYMVGGWMSTESWLRRNPDAARAFVAVMVQAARWANGHQKESAEILVRHTRILPAVARAMARTHYADAGTINPETVQRPIDMMVRFGAIHAMAAKEIIATP